jgi:hypothetical protein
MYFNGSTDYLTVGNDTGYDLAAGDFTIEFWTYPTSTAAQQILVNKLSNGTSVGAFDIRLNTNGTLIIYIANASGVTWYTNITTSLTVAFNAWNHVAFVRSGNVFTCYINGVSAGTVTAAITLIYESAKSVNVGANGDGTYKFTGYMSEVHIVKGTALYTAAFTPPTAPVTAISNSRMLLKGTNASVYDSMAKNDIITVGSCQLSTTQSKFGGSSIYFGGAGNYLYSPSNSMLSFGTGDFTIEFWMYPTAAFSTTRVFSTYTGGIAIYPNNSGNIVVDAYGVATRVTTSSTVSINTWTHIAVVRSSGTTTVYIGGISGGSGSDSSNYTNTGLYIGSDNGTNGYTGYLDEIRIARYARYTANFTPKTSAFQNQ